MAADPVEKETAERTERPQMPAESRVTAAKKVGSRIRLAVAILLVLAVIAVGLKLFWTRFGHMAWLWAQGYHTPMHLFVIESDDWHLSGTPGPEAIAALKAKGYNPTVWSKDAQETVEDLDALFAVLSKHKDSTGRPACFTANVVMTRPDFDRIRAGDFQEYFVLPKDRSWPKELLAAYRRGMEVKVFYPQLHGYDHMIPEAWIGQLKAGDVESRMLFGLGIRSDPQTVLGKGATWKAEFVDLSAVPSRTLGFERQQAILAKANKLFSELFGFGSLSLIPPYYFSDDNTLRACAAEGIRYIQAADGQCESVDASGKIVVKSRHLGQPTGFGGMFLIRTCGFRPTVLGDGAAEDCIRQAESRFRMHLPAVINSHRINYVGGLDADMAKLARRELDDLLTAVESEYPDVRYLTTPELGELISTGGYKDVFSGRRIELPSAQEALVAWLWNIGLIWQAAAACLVLSGVVIVVVWRRRTRAGALRDASAA